MVCGLGSNNQAGQGQSELTIHLTAQEAMAKFTVEKDIAQHIKKTV